VGEGGGGGRGGGGGGKKLGDFDWKLLWNLVPTSCF